MAIRIDTSKYEAEKGKPVGRAFWAFTIVSPSITYKDKYWRSPEPMTFDKACEKVREVAELRKAELILLELD